MKLYIIHPGIQHAPRLANAALRSGLFNEVYLITSILFKLGTTAFGILKKRIKPIDHDVIIINNYIYTLFFELSKFVYNKLYYNPKDQSHNNPIYFWQQIFGYLCLPRIWFNRKNLLVICFETAGYPVAKYCKKWNIPIIMDFASISHEKAKEFGINETKYGIKLKIKERQFIDYAFFCSQFCEESFIGKTSARKDFVVYLGAEEVESLKLKVENKVYQELRYKNQGTNRGTEKDKIVKISFIANLEYRKGLDILLEAIYSYQYPVFLETHLIGKIRKEWVESHMPKIINNHQIELIYKTPMGQQELFAYLSQEQFDLNVQPSRFDSFAMVVPETMMLGIPNLVSPFVGAGEMFHYKLKKFIMKDNSAVALNDCMDVFLKMSNLEKKELKALVLQNAKVMTWSKYEQKVKYVLGNILENIRISQN